MVKIHALCFVVRVRGVQDVLAMEQPPQFPHFVDFAFAVSARNRQPELAVHPQPVIVDGHHVVQQHLLPIHGGAAALLVQLDGLAAFGLIIRQYKRLCGGWRPSLAVFLAMRSVTP